MKEIINSEFYKKYEKIIKKLFIIFIIFLILLFIWLVFVKNIVSFKTMENNFESAGKLYFEKNLNKYPKNVNDVKSVSLQELYNRKLITSLYIPGRKKLCSTNNSWVKVKKTKNGYEFYTYLECGKYKSSTDHEGPEIILNGAETINLEYGSSYKELGIKTVEDKKEGKLSTKDVSITGKVDSKKVGTYKIKYVAYDSLKNKTIKYRNIRVIKTLSYIAKEDNKDGIYRGNSDNNYVLYSGMIFRIIKANDDGTVKLITNDSLANISYSTGMKKDGYVYNWLNDYYYNKLYKPNDFIVESDWCLDETGDVNYNNLTCQKTIKANVGLPTLAEYNQSFENEYSYINNGMTFWTMTGKDKNSTWSNHNTFKIEENNNDAYNGVRAVLNMKKGTSVKSGNGSEYNPYVIDGYEVGKSGQKLNTRYAGEYIKYSGYLWRIIDTDDDGNIKVVMDNVLKDADGKKIEIGYGSSYDNKPKMFNVTNKDNIGYKLNHELKDYLITKKMVKGTYEVNYYKNGILDTNAKNKKVECLLSIPDITELFSIGSASRGQASYFIRNTVKSDEKILVVNAMRQTDEFYNFVFEKASVKVVTMFDKNSLIKGGSGTKDNPYIMR